MPSTDRSVASAVVVTRGDQDLGPIFQTLDGFDELIIWNNALETDLSVYGRYAGVAQARNPAVFVQDDDCLLTAAAIDALLAAYTPGEIIANMPEGRWPDYPDSCLVGWGTVFDRDLPEAAFDRFSAHRFDPADEQQLAEAPDMFFARTCDVVFTTLTPHRKLDLGFQHLPWAETPGRMFKQPGHKQERDRMLELARQVRDHEAA